MTSQHQMADCPVNTKHLYTICTMFVQCRGRWPVNVQMLQKCFVFTGWTLSREEYQRSSAKGGIRRCEGRSRRRLEEESARHICKGYKLENIFTADETGLFYCTLPNRSLVVKGDACKGWRKAKDMMTALVACSAMGETLKLFEFT